jgi:hypothetical protein
MIVHVLLTAVRKRRWVRMAITCVITVDRGRGTRNPIEMMVRRGCRP